MPVQDQAVWKSVSVVTGGNRQRYARGDLLPPPATDREANQRTLLRLGGALRVVEVVYTPEEVAAQRQARGQSPAQAAASAGIPAAVAPTGDDPRGGAPVVLGPKPKAKATKGDWVAYAIAYGLPQTEAEAMTLDALIAAFPD